MGLSTVVGRSWVGVRGVQLGGVLGGNKLGGSLVLYTSTVATMVSYLGRAGGPLQGAIRGLW